MVRQEAGLLSPKEKEIKKRMSRIELNQPAPDFTLIDINGNEVRLSDFQGKKNVLLIFNRGFA